ncbi:bifunctional lysylphosphatidylglycerol flippase/synthetase MprF [Psychrobacillus vulpis]|uniref:bifunctional lysylphosphatidylglycerol flippase/synthetase MprF n=1 Tax=Psychrobacillus vulpis TaxID=2325572 RepID=UPI0014099E64|nr:bifunctional lysylphosphatidylglycerol flippase/synthetase MprF [Psychrobacillus vulpis]
MIQFWKTQWFSRVLKITIPLLIFTVLYIESNQALKNLDFTLLKDHFKDLALYQVIMIVVLGIFAVSPMLLYDFVLSRHLRMVIPVKKKLIYSWTANTMSNFIGFGGIAGMMIRTFFYGQYGYDKKTLVKGIGLITLFYLSGMSLLSWFPLLGIIQTPIFQEVKWIHFALIGIALYFPILIISIRKNKKASEQKHINSKNIFLLAVISLLEWIFAFVLIYFISVFLGVSVSIPSMFATFIVASFAGIISMLPGGIGSFDLMFLLGLEGLGVPTEFTLLILLLYRISYFILPALVGAIMLLFHFWGEMNQKLNRIPSIILQNISHWIVTAFVLLAGITLLLTAAAPTALERIKVPNELLALPLMNLSHQLTVGLGISLLMLTRGIQYRVKWAYHLTLITLIVAAVFSLSKWFDYEDAAFVLVVFIVLLLSKNHFYRENFVPTWGKSIVDIIGIGLILGLFIFIGYVNLPSSNIIIPAKLQPYVITESTDLFHSALTGIILALLYMTAGYLLNKPRNFPFEKSNSYEDEIKAHLDKYEGTALSHLIFLHDKYIFWNQSRTVMLSFQKYSDKLIVLGDLIGEKADILRAMEEFHDRANVYGYTPVYYQVTSKMFPYLHENGYDFFKLGEEAFVDLPSFELSGKKMKNLRANKNKLEREGYCLQVIQPPHSDAFLASLKLISDEWLDGRKEKGFSLGWFDATYLKTVAIALVVDGEGKSVAFCNIMPAYDNGKMVSIDLMRYAANAPNATMDFLFIKLFEWYKEKKYEKFNLGMAPLANVGLSKYSFLTEKIAYQIFLYGHAVYHFKGLKKFKEKYADHWEPKYLALRKKASLPITMAQVSLLIARSGPNNKNKWMSIFSKFY